MTISSKIDFVHCVAIHGDLDNLLHPDYKMELDVLKKESLDRLIAHLEKAECKDLGNISFNDLVKEYDVPDSYKKYFLDIDEDYDYNPLKIKFDFFDSPHCNFNLGLLYDIKKQGITGVKVFQHTNKHSGFILKLEYESGFVVLSSFYEIKGMVQ